MDNQYICILCAQPTLENGGFGTLLCSSKCKIAVWIDTLDYFFRLEVDNREFLISGQNSTKYKHLSIQISNSTYNFNYIPYQQLTLDYIHRAINLLSLY